MAYLFKFEDCSFTCQVTWRKTQNTHIGLPVLLNWRHWCSSASSSTGLFPVTCHLMCNAWQMYPTENTYARQHHPYQPSLLPNVLLLAATLSSSRPPLKLPEDISSATSLSVFRRQLKTHLFDNAIIADYVKDKSSNEANDNMMVWAKDFMYQLKSQSKNCMTHMAFK